MTYSAWKRSIAMCLFAALAITVQSSAQIQIITFDPPGSITTNPASINPKGEITGSYTDAGFVHHGFLRSSDGTITSF